MKTVPLIQLARIIRSKNSGPFELTLDVFFKSPEIYRRARARRLIRPDLIARLYRVPRDRVLEVVWFDPAAAVKATLARPTPSGGPDDTDVYGAQQHLPLMNLRVPWED